MKIKRLGIPLGMNVLAVSGVVFAAIMFLTYIFCIHHTDVSHVGIMRNFVTGEMNTDTQGWNLTAPWVKVAKIDTRPVRVCVTTAGKGFNCKLVQFKVSEWREFVVVEGFYYWWWANRISFNSGYNEEYRGMRDLIRGYAFSLTKYKFISDVEGY
ncbi:MAG TPA: hypothetical protein P5230_00650 [Candidatus Magasanikbacteria bacterium]|nr:hypothetical protein [Candidatus Magasanikbacteria bacterium]